MTEVPGNAPGFGFAHAVTVSGALAFVSGQVPLDADGRLVGPDDTGAQTAQALENLGRVLVTLGADWPDVVKLTWFLTEAADLQPVRDARDALLRPALGDRPNPASSLVRVAGLFRPDVLVEVEAVVALPTS
ncbi:RidA family protein [Hamadaea tsunoensis]|uniref:RidA family protein n=1 Tax=Hamadaea tsunoensis TaxID=53368 RepID=UPI00040CE105|nr:RidA family protein [Hamadaea tsunoensis]